MPSAAVIEPTLRGERGDLLSVSIAVDAHHLEDLLEQLSSIAFPINPELKHCPPVTRVEFPVFSGQLEEVLRALQLANLGGTVQLGLALPIR